MKNINYQNFILLVEFSVETRSFRDMDKWNYSIKLLIIFVKKCNSKANCAIFYS